MKLLSFLFLVMPICLSAQLVSDDFESYELGAFDTQWNASEWSGMQGAEISDEYAFSGNLSLKINEDNAKEEVSALLPVMESGVWEVAFMQYIPSGSGASFYFERNNALNQIDTTAIFNISDTSVFFIISEGNRNGEFGIIHNKWIENRFEFNFLTQMANFYYNDKLVHRWSIPQNIDGEEIFNKIEFLRLTATCAWGNCTSEVYYDNFQVQEMALSEHDASLIFERSVSEYTQVPLNHNKPFIFNVGVVNQGTKTIHDLVIKAMVYDETNNLLHTEELAIIDSLTSTQFETVESTEATFTPVALGAYTIKYELSSSQVDQNLSNNTLISPIAFRLTDGFYSRSDRFNINGIGVGVGALDLAQKYEIAIEQEVLGITVVHTGSEPGDYVVGHIYSATANGEPGNKLHTTNQVELTEFGGDIGFSLQVELNFSEEVILAPGTYFFAVETNAYVAESQKIHTHGSVWGNTGGAWQNLDGFGNALDINPIFSSTISNVNNQNELKDIRLFPNPSSGAISVQFETSMHNDVVISVYDTQGKELFKERHSNANGVFQIDLELSDLTKGMYLLKLQAEEFNGSRKIIIVDE